MYKRQPGGFAHALHFAQIVHAFKGSSGNDFLGRSQEKSAIPKAKPAQVAPAPAASPAPPAKPAATEKGQETAAKLAPGQKVNINTASKEDLDKLFEIGPVKAQAIIDGRPCPKIEDLMKVKGIKGGIFEKIKDHITVN